MILCYIASFFIINLTPYIAGPVPSAVESGGAIPSNIWLSTWLHLGGMLLLAAGFICQVWAGTRFSLFMDERCEERKKHDAGI